MSYEKKSVAGKVYIDLDMNCVNIMTASNDYVCSFTIRGHYDLVFWEGVDPDKVHRFWFDGLPSFLNKHKFFEYNIQKYELVF